MGVIARWVLVAAFAGLLVEDAWAHGGGGFRGPGGALPPGARGDPMPPPPPPPPGGAERIACDCGRERCKHCRARPQGTVRHAPLARTEVARWGDLAHVRLTQHHVAGKPTTTVHDGHVALALGRTTAVVGLKREDGTGVRTGAFRPAQLARRDYLLARDKSRGRAALVTRGDDGLALRIFRVPMGEPVALTFDTFELRPDPKDRRVRTYYTRLPTGSERMLVIMPTSVVPKGLKPSYVHAASGMATYFLSPVDARLWLGLEAGAATEVPCVHALESALTGRGSHAVNQHTALLVQKAKHRAPWHLAVGPAKGTKAKNAKEQTKSKDAASAEATSGR